MATANPFDILGGDDNDDPTQLIAAQQQKIAAKKPASPAPAVAKLPSKPLPPAKALRDARNSTEPARVGVGRGGPGRGRGSRGDRPFQSRDFGNENANGYPRAYSGSVGGGGGGGGEDGYAGKPEDRERERPPWQPFREGGYRGGYQNEETRGDSERPPRRMYERRSGTGRGYEVKRDGAGRGNWGTVTDETFTQETEQIVKSDGKIVASEKQTEQEDAAPVEENKDNKEVAANEAEEKEPEDKEMTLEEYEKVREERRKTLLAPKTEERKVEIDKELQSMQLLSTKKGNDGVFIKLASDKDSQKKKENAERDERVKKSLSINEFLKPSEGERYYSPGGRGRGRGRGERGQFSGFGGGARSLGGATPKIEDQEQFPTLGGK